jgi:PAS domain S-box-containing protein
MAGTGAKNLKERPTDKLNLLDQRGMLFNDFDNEKASHVLLSNLIIDNTSIGILLLDNRFKCIYANTEMANIIGYSEKKLVGCDIRGHLPNESKEIVCRYVQHKAKRVLSEKFTMDFFRKGGDRRTTETSISILQLSDSQTLTVINAFDITDQIQKIAALEEKEKKYRLLVEKMEDFCFEVDIFGNLTFVNEAMINHSGYTKDELLGLNYLEFTLPGEKDRLFKFYSAIYETGKPGKMQYQAIRKDGSVGYYESKVTLKTDDTGKPIGFRSIAREISNQELTEKIWQESEQQLKTIIDGSPVPTIVLNKNRDITHWNKACEDLSGVQANDVIGKNKYELSDQLKRLIVADLLINNDAHEKIESTYSSVVKQSYIVKNAYEMEAHFPELGKSGKWLYLTSAFLKDFEDNVTGTIQTLLDITYRKQAEIKLQKSEKKYRDLFQNMLDFVFIHDLEGNFIDTNFHYISEMGGIHREVVNSNLRDLMPKKTRHWFDKYLIRIKKRGRDEGVVPIMIPSGETRRLEYKNLLLNDENGHPVGVIGSARDITEQLEIKKMINENEKRLKTIIDGSPIPTIVQDKNHIITHWNKACEDLTGIPANDVIGNHIQLTEKFFKQQILSNFLNNGVPIEEIENYYSTKCRQSDIVKDAHEVEVFFPKLGKKGKWLYLTAAFLKDSEENITGTIETLLDISTRKYAEKIQAKMHEALEKKVEDRTRELQEINTALEVLLKKREKDKQELEERVAYNIKEVLEPHLKMLKDTPLDKHQKIYLEILESNFQEISSPFLQTLSDTMQKLTPTEIQVINLIKQNKSSKQIADYMGISPRTIEFHRDNIREKFGIKNQKINLKTYLMSMK